MDERSISESLRSSLLPEQRGHHGRLWLDRQHHHRWVGGMDCLYHPESPDEYFPQYYPRHRGRGGTERNPRLSLPRRLWRVVGTTDRRHHRRRHSDGDFARGNRAQYLRPIDPGGVNRRVWRTGIPPARWDAYMLAE